MTETILGYQFFEKEIATSARSELVSAKALPKGKGDVTIYWQDYEEAALDKPAFWYMHHDKSMDATLGKASEFKVTLPSEDASFVGKYGEPISAYSLRNLTSNAEQFVIQVSNGEETFDLLETQVADRFYLETLGKTLRVVKWYDQAGTDQTLNASELFAPYLKKDGFTFSVNRLPAIKFDTGNKIELTTFLRPERDNLRTYNVGAYSTEQEEVEGGNSLLYNAGRFTQPIINWLPEDKLQALLREPIFQNKIKVGAEEDQFGPFPSPLKNLNLYQIQNALSAPINFGFGEGINMLMTEFIIYPDATANVEDVTENILEYYKITSFTPIGDEPGLKPKK